MILTGIDMVEIPRIQKSISNSRFMNRIFGPLEKGELETSGRIAQRAASGFAAKEAFGKALGTGMCGFLFNEVEVLHDMKGAPYFHLSGKAGEIVKTNKLSISLSITHTAHYAVAVVVISTENERLCFD